MTKLRFIIYWLLLIAPSSLEAVPRNDALSGIIAVSSGGETSVIHTQDIEIGKQRTDFVRHILKDRLKYVRNGRRMADFHTWIRKRGGEFQVLSTHGVDAAATSATAGPEKFNYDENESSLNVIRKNDPFAMNRLDLDLPINNLPNLYEGKPIHLMDDLAPSVFQLFWRTVQLSLKFSPVLSTTWLALLSTKFRKVWYKWVATSLGELQSSSLQIVKGFTLLTVWLSERAWAKDCFLLPFFF